jgi:hypothetical protein
VYIYTYIDFSYFRTSENKEVNDEKSRRRALARERLRRYRQRKRLERRANKEIEVISEEDLIEKLEHRRELARERSRRYRRKKLLQKLGSNNVFHDLQITETFHNA